MVEGVSIQLEGGVTGSFSADFKVRSSGDASGEMTIRGIDFTEKYVILEGRSGCGTEAPNPVTIGGYFIEESEGTSTKSDFTAAVRPSEGGTGVIIDFNTSDSDKQVEVDGVLRVTSEACDDPQ